MTEGRTAVRLRILAALCAFMFAALGTRLWFVQVLAFHDNLTKARENGIRLVPVPAARGRILDRTGHMVMVGNTGTLAVTVNRQEIGDQAEEVLYRLSQVLNVPAAMLVHRLDDPRYYPYQPVPVAFGVPKESVFYIGEHPELFPGVATPLQTVRTYPEGNLAVHILGTTGAITKQQLQAPQFAGYKQDAVVGQSGIELTYEHFLQGTPGLVKYQINSAGRNLGAIGRQPARPGADVVLTINASVQRLAQQSLQLAMDAGHKAGLKADAGAVVVENPNNGQILAMASLPNYDPNTYAKDFNRLKKEKASPFYNRAIQGQYPAGSTFKPFIALAALKQGITTETKPWKCPAVYNVPVGPNNPPEVKDNWSPVDLGYMALPQALVESCDTVFYQFGWQFWLQYAHFNPKLHRRQHFQFLQQDLRSFGFGRPTGLDIPSEEAGLVPDAQYKAHRPFIRQTCNNIWCPGDDLNLSIGQGDLKVTPLQMANAYSAIANGGTVYRTHLALRIQRPGGRVVQRIAPQVDGHLPFSKQQLSFIRRSLTGVTQNRLGTAYFAFKGFPFNKVTVAGKTGTAEVPPFQPYSWFAAMAPADHPKYVVVALVEQGGHGSQTAAPVVRRVLEGLFHFPLSNPVVQSVQD